MSIISTAVFYLQTDVFHLCYQVCLTLCLDPQCSSNQSKQRCVEHYSAIAVQRHVHRHETLGRDFNGHDIEFNGHDIDFNGAALLI